MAIPTNEGYLVLDSGADTLFLFRAPAHDAHTGGMTSSAFGATVGLGLASPIVIGGRSYHADKAAFRTVPDAEEASLLPASLFRAVFISNSERYVVFDP